MTNQHLYYTGNPALGRNQTQWEKLPPVRLEKSIDPSRYIAPKGLVEAVNVAIHLGLPLLLTGEPGVGKSSLARSLNYELGYEDNDLLHFTVKSDTRDSDLFYNYDTLGRFHAVHGKQSDQEADPRRFIRYQGLGMAILLAKGREGIRQLDIPLMTEEKLADFPEQRRRAVVLIDEIDKAPRDMPNDILNEIERMEFRIPELFIDQPIKLDSEQDKQHRPFVIITSNGERELPEAFLRRCLYYHLTMPNFKQDLNNPQELSVEAIVSSRFDQEFEGRQQLLNQAVSLYRYLRQPNLSGIQRPPSLAEFLDWLRYLSKVQSLSNLTDLKQYRTSLQATLLKNIGDQQKIEQYVNEWQNAETNRS